MKISILPLMLLFGTLAFAQDQDDNAQATQQANQANQIKQQNDHQKGQKDQKDQKGDASSYHSPYTTDISKTSFGATANPLAQGSVTNANPQQGQPALDFHRRHPHKSSTAHDAKADAKAAAKAPYDPREYQSKADPKP